MNKFTAGPWTFGTADYGMGKESCGWKRGKPEELPFDAIWGADRPVMVAQDASSYVASMDMPNEADMELILAAPTMLNLLERVAECCIWENPDNSMDRQVICDDLDPDLIEEILAFLSKIGRHP